MLNLKDKNIHFDENFCDEEIIKGVRSLVFYGTLTYIPSKCQVCSHTFDKHIQKHGFKTSLIKLPQVSNMNTYLKLRKQRYICYYCHHTFTLETSVVDKNCFISNNTKVAIALEAQNKISEKDIAKRFNVSSSTVNRTIYDLYKMYKPNFNYLPENLCFDEFKSVKEAAGAMSFIFCDASNGKIIDIVEDRRLTSLKTYFNHYTREARAGVKNIVIDMYKPYIVLIKELFPNAKIIMDKFHIVQLIHRSLNKTRVSIMNSQKEDYNKLKRYWKLLLKDRSKLDIKNHNWSPCFKSYLCEEDIVNNLLVLNPELHDTYEIYQDILHAIKAKNIARLNYILDNYKNNYPHISSYMIKSLKSIIKNLPYVINMINSSFNNGVIEGINNKIKVIKRISFGYRSYLHMKARILITQGHCKIKVA